MRVDPHPSEACWPTITSALAITTPQGEQLIVDPAGKLEQGCTVAVFVDGRFILVGQVLRRPVAHWRLVIGYRDVQGNESVSRVFGLRDHHTLVWRVVGVIRDI